MIIVEPSFITLVLNIYFHQSTNFNKAPIDIVCTRRRKYIIYIINLRFFFFYNFNIIIKHTYLTIHLRIKNM